MKTRVTVFLLFLLWAAAAKAQLTGPLSGAGTGSGNSESLFANLPASPTPGTLVTVTNTNGAGCNGSGSTSLLCEWNGSAWVVVGNGTVTTTGGDVFGPVSATDGKSVLFDTVSGKLIKESALTGLIKETNGLPSVAVQGTDYYAPGGTDVAVTDGGTGAGTAAGARTNLGLVIGTDVLGPTGSAAALTSFPIFNQNTTGTAINATLAAAATTLASTPTLCDVGDAPRGILATGNATGCFTPVGGGGGSGLSGLTPNFALRATGATQATTSTLISDSGTVVGIGDITGTRMSFNLDSAPAGVETAVKLPPSASPVIVGGIADPVDANCVYRIGVDGVQYRVPCVSQTMDGLTKIINANSLSTALQVWDDAALTNGAGLYISASQGVQFVCITPSGENKCNYIRKLDDGYIGGFSERAGTNIFTVTENNAKGIIKFTLGSDATGDTYYRNSIGEFVRLAIGATNTNLTVVAGLPAWVAPKTPATAVSMTERGATTIALESIVSNQPKRFWATVTDVNTDGLDFVLPITVDMATITTMTVRLLGVSKNAAPSGNVVFTCAIKAVRPGTDTYVAHSTTGEQTITLTPAVQNRPVAVTSPAITINGTVASGGQLEGSCEVDATGTTSAQMSDFRVEAQALVTW